MTFGFAPRRKAAAMDSKTVFAQAVKDLELDALMPKFLNVGWDTFANFAFCVPDFSGKDGTAFEAVMTEFLAKDDSQKHLKTRLRRLYAQAYYSTSVSLSNATEEKDPAAKVTMHIADRVSRTEGLRKRIVGFKFEHHNMPGNALINKANTILVTGVVRWIAWIICISRASKIGRSPR